MMLMIASLIVGVAGTWNPNVQKLDLMQTDADIRGIKASFTDGNWGYVIPWCHYWYTGLCTGKVARFSLSDFSTVQVLDLKALEPDAPLGFLGGFTHGDYGYLVPGYKGLGDPHGKVVRFDLAGFDNPRVLDLTQTGSNLKRFQGGFTDGTYGYVVPHYGPVARFLLSGFDDDNFDVQTLTTNMGGYHGGRAIGAYGYLTMRERRSVLARFPLNSFQSDSVEYLDLAVTDPALAGYEGEFTDGTWYYLVPTWSDHLSRDFGKVVRVSLADFSTVEVLDVTELTKDIDPQLKSFAGGMIDTAGTHGYMVKNAHPKFGQVVRFPLSTFDSVEVFDMKAVDSDFGGFKTGFWSGSCGYYPTFGANNNFNTMTGFVARFGDCVPPPTTTTTEIPPTTTTENPPTTTTEIVFVDDAVKPYSFAGTCAALVAGSLLHLVL